MNYYENLEHGTKEFPIGVHDTLCENGFSLYPHLHREFEFLVLNKGRGKIFIDDVEYEINEGDVVFINSEALHVGVSIDESKAEFFAIVFAPEMFGSFGDDVIMNKYVFPVMNKMVGFQSIYSIEVPWQCRAIELLRDIHDVYRLAKPCYELRIKAMLMEVWELCFNESVSIHKSTASDRSVEDMKKVFAYINREYMNSLSLEDMASQINMSRGYFCRRFSEIMHMTPFEYLMQVRIENSSRMLREGKLAVGEIALECGFNSFSYFSKTFKRFTGYTPSKYQKAYNYLA